MPTPEDDDLDPASASDADVKAARAEADAAKRELAEAKLETARSKALQQYPNLSADLLEEISGTPEQVMAYAERLNTAITTRVDAARGQAPEVPVPTPGPGDHAQPADAQEARRLELREKAILKNLDKHEAEELSTMGVRAALQTVTAGRR